MVDRVVFDVELPHAEARGQPIGLDERREARMQTGLRLAVDRQELAVAPEVLGPAFDERPRHLALHQRIVKRDLERPEARAADPQWARGIFLVAEMATKLKRAHGVTS